VRAGLGPLSGLGVVALALWWLACQQPPIVRGQTYAKASGLFGKVAVAPFYPTPALERSTIVGGVSASEASELVARFFAEELERRGIPTVPANDLLIAFEGSGQVIPRGDGKAVADLAAREFGATSVVIGEVNRYREREGENYGALRPASVGFAVTIHRAPDGLRAWAGRFDETQPSMTADLQRVRQYPGGGTRWLTAGELARWGVSRTIDAVPQVLR
jgi:nucleotide-binding universal stress UspA family protein